jgi:hypothetical protein
MSGGRARERAMRSISSAFVMAASIAMGRLP